MIGMGIWEKPENQYGSRRLAIADNKLINKLEWIKQYNNHVKIHQKQAKSQKIEPQMCMNL